MGQEMLDKAGKMLDFNLLELCLKGPESELERLGRSLSESSLHTLFGS